MGDRSNYDRVVPVHNLRDYFRTSVEDVVAKQGVEVDPHATHYVVNLITLFSRSEELYEDDGETYGLKPLAIMLADAADAPSPDHRTQTLQRIGDVAMFISGFFIESLENKAVDVLQSAQLFNFFIQLIPHRREGLVAEGSDPQDDRLAHNTGPNGGQLDGVADNRHVKWLGFTLSDDCHDNLATDRTAH